MCYLFAYSNREKHYAPSSDNARDLLTGSPSTVAVRWAPRSAAARCRRPGCRGRRTRPGSCPSCRTAISWNRRRSRERSARGSRRQAGSRRVSSARGEDDDASASPNTATSRIHEYTRAGGERVPLFRFNRSPRDAHAIPSSRIRKTTSLLDERIAIITKERRVPSLRVRVRSRSRSIESKQTLSPLPSKTQRPTHHDDAYGTTQRWTRDPIIALPCVKTA